MIGNNYGKQRLAASFAAAIFLGMIATQVDRRILAAEPNQPVVAAASNAGELRDLVEFLAGLR